MIVKIEGKKTGTKEHGIAQDATWMFPCDHMSHQKFWSPSVVEMEKMLRAQVGDHTMLGGLEDSWERPVGEDGSPRPEGHVAVMVLSLYEHGGHRNVVVESGRAIYLLNDRGDTVERIAR